MYDTTAEAHGLEWSWVDDQLAGAGAYWTVTPGDSHPHPRPVWGVWSANTLYLSIGSPTLRAAAASNAPMTAHLGSVTDVVIVEGVAVASTDDRSVLDAYNNKYDWDYTIDQYGPFTIVAPSKVMAWRSAGWAGRDGFRTTGRWTFARHDSR